MKLGIVGLPNVGKSTLFNCLTNAKGAEAANYPFCTIEPNVGIVTVPDEREEKLRDMYDSQKIVPAVIEFVDIAGLVKGASKGEGLGNKFLSHIREVDAIVHVVRCFEDPNVVHVDGSIDPIRDIETINLELIFADLETTDKRLQKAVKEARGDKKMNVVVDALTGLKAHLESNKAARGYEMPEQAADLLTDFNLLTSKPILYAANVAEDEVSEEDNEFVKKVRGYATEENNEVFKVSAKLEEELADLDGDEKTMFLEDLGIKYTGLDLIIAASYRLLGLISYFTAGPKEIHSWTIKDGTKGPGAAGRIHTDFEKGFIRAEVVSYADLMNSGSMAKAKESGLVRMEGKDYVVKDGDVILFHFSS
ncbi:MAG: redox-regulated ATPase YchF [Clostridia bacterium]|jgi:GTP-binding protein YchF|nr:redox-regulated ATPase YchF [Clostridia bacterium]